MPTIHNVNTNSDASICLTYIKKFEDKKLNELEALIKENMRQISLENQNFIVKILAHPATGAISAILFIASIALLATATGGIALGVVGLVVGIGFFSGHLAARHPISTNLKITELEPQGEKGNQLF